MDAEETRTIGRRVKRIRYDRHKPLVVVAGLAGMSKSKLDRIERGEIALDKLSDIVALADALEIAPGDLVRLPVPAPANGHTDSTTEAVGHALDAIEDEDPEGLVLPVAVLREQLLRIHAQRRACQFAEMATDLPGLIRNLHTTLATGADHAELLDLAVYLHVHVTRIWLRHAGAHTHLVRRVVYLAQRLARERDEVTTLAMAEYGVAMELLLGGVPQRGQAKLEAIALPPTTAKTAGLVASLTSEHATAAVLNGRPGDVTAPMNAAAELAERFGATGEPDSLGFLYGPDRVAIDRMWLALEADEPDQAESVAYGVNPRHLPVAVNRSFFWIHRGRALARLPGLQDDAVRALRTAERIFPIAVLRHQGVREVLGRVADPGVGARDERRVAGDGLPRRPADGAGRRLTGGRHLGTHPKREVVRRGLAVRIWSGWWSFQDGCVVVGGAQRRVVGVAGSGLRFRLIVGDGWGLGVVGTAQGACPDGNRVIIHTGGRSPRLRGPPS